MAGSMKPKDVVIVGGSLGGLFAGIVLKRLGHNIRILERSPTALLHNQGAGVVAGGETLRFFSEYDLTRSPLAVISPFRHYLDKRGEEVSREYREQRMTSWDLLYNLLRANFDGESDRGYVDIPPSADGEGSAIYDYGCKVVDVRENEDGLVDVVFLDSNAETKTIRAPFVIAADGANSTLRSMLEPDVKWTYAGYVAWRGTCAESRVSQSVYETLVEKFTFFHAQGMQALAYVIPGKHGTLERGQRLINWVWYCNYEHESPELRDLMTDIDGIRHRVTLRKIQPRIWEAQKEYASRSLPPQLAEIIHETQQPFIQAIGDVMSTRSLHFEGKILSLGDAIAGFRPHTAASTSQAAFNALLLAELFKGNITSEEYENRVTSFAQDVASKGIFMGNRSQFGSHPLAS